MPGRHQFGRSGGQAEAVVLQKRIADLQAELATYSALAEHRRHVINALKVGIATLIVTLSFALGVNSAPVRQAIADLVQTLGFAGAVKDADAAYAAYQRGNYATALRYLRPLSDQGDPRAQSILGLMYYHGRGVSQDDPEALKWFRLAAEQGDAPAQFNLGVMYAEGQGVPQDYAEAVKWYRLAADRGHAQAQYNLGLSYVRGEGVSQDYVSAHTWFNLAASHFPASSTRNHDLAVRNRDLAASKMTREQIAEAQKLAREWQPR
jgi:tetratricopeptide (TPR) repeat protein